MAMEADSASPAQSRHYPLGHPLGCLCPVLSVVAAGVGAAIFDRYHPNEASEPIVPGPVTLTVLISNAETATIELSEPQNAGFIRLVPKAR